MGIEPVPVAPTAWLKFTAFGYQFAWYPGVYEQVATIALTLVIFGWLIRRFHRQLIYSYAFLGRYVPPVVADFFELLLLGMGAIFIGPCYAVFYFWVWWEGKVKALIAEAKAREDGCPPPPPPLNGTPGSGWFGDKKAK